MVYILQTKYMYLGVIKIEYRKLISFGKSSYVVSLPKYWVDKQKLRKGDLIYFDETGNNLLLQPKESSRKEEEKEIIITVDNKDILQIKREVNSAYTLGYHTLILKGDKLKGKIKEIQEIIQNLMALEIMEQNPTTIIAKDFLRMDTVSLNELIRKMDLISRTMIGESILTFSEDRYEDINHRDEDVNRLYLLLRRAVFYKLTNQLKTAKESKLGPIDLVGYLFVAFYIEGIADEARRISRHMRLVKINRQQQEVFENIFRKVRDFYLETMKAFYNLDVSLAFKLSNDKKRLMNELDPFYATHSKNGDVVNMVNRLRRMISCVHHLGRIVYQEFNYGLSIIPE